MERDFMGLGSSHLPAPDSSAAAAAAACVTNMRNSGGGGAYQWSFSNKVSAVPQFLSFQTAPDQEKPRRSIFDQVASPSSFMSISNADAFDSGNRRGSSAVIQKNWNLVDNKAENSHRTVAAAYSGHPVSVSTPILQSHFASTIQSGYGNSITIQPLGGVPITTPISVVPATSSVIGTTELRNSPKFSGSTAQLTIFYAGSVCVYDDVTPEKAKAILSMAKTGSSPSQTTQFPPSTVQHQPIIQNHLAMDDHTVLNRSSRSPPGSSIPSPISISSSTSNESRTTRSLAASSTIHLEPSSSIPSSTSRPPSAAPQPTAGGVAPQVRIPQARKASLARFLEKRKERATSTSSPYHSMSKKSAEEGHVCV